jgi:hypothetical protein
LLNHKTPVGRVKLRHAAGCVKGVQSGDVGHHAGRPNVKAVGSRNQKTGLNFGSALFLFETEYSHFSKHILRIEPGHQDHGIGIRRHVVGKIDRESVNRAERGIGNGDRGLSAPGIAISADILNFGISPS